MKLQVLIGALGALAAAGLTMAQEAPPAPPAEAAGIPAPPAPSPPDLGPPPEEAAPAPLRAAPRAAEPAPEADAPPKPAEPLKRPRYGSAILQAVDKITAETLRFEAKVNQPVRYKGVIVTVHACESTAADEPAADSMAHLEVLSQPVAAPGKPALPPRQVFRGWTFANSPALHPFEHPVYDLWLIACRTPAPEVSAGKA